MKSYFQKFSMIMLGLLFSVVLSAHNSVTVNNTPGQLKNNLADIDWGTITSLTITGSMDARDFKFMRDSMPALAEIDMSLASVEYYMGPQGPMSDTWSYEYPANKVPSHAFCNPEGFSGKTSLVSVKLPKVRAVLHNSFWGCTNLQTVVFPSTVTTIGDGAFRNCSSLVNMEIPPFIKSLERYVFQGCTSLTSVTLPSTLISIKDNVFTDCTSLISVRIISLTPDDFLRILEDFGAPDNLFTNVDKENCILYVPYGTKELYQAAEGWREFTHIVEAAEGFILSADSLQFPPYGGADYSLSIRANTQWTAVSSMPWLSVSSATGNRDEWLVVTVAPNPLVIPRKGTLTFTAEGSPTRVVTIKQEAYSGILNVTPGSLSSELDKGDPNQVTSLTLSGQIDARDFKTIRDELRGLIQLDLSGVTIVAYSGTRGTVEGMQNYPANEVPPYAFFQTDYYFGLHKVQQITLPPSVVAIGEYAFASCYRLNVLNIPPEVTSIGRNAFQFCFSLNQLNIPQGITTIETGLFRGSGLNNALLPNSITTIKDSAFSEMYYLMTASIPASVNSIGTRAFYYCQQMNDLYAFPVTPPDLSNSEEVFAGVNMNSCILHVPRGSADLYAVAEQWKDFLQIVEMDLPMVGPGEPDWWALPTSTEETEQTTPAFKCYPNPFTDQLSIKIANPSLKEMTVEIYSILGQKIRSLAQAQKGTTINCTWDGKDESGQKVRNGMYILKMGQLSKQVLFNGN